MIILFDINDHHKNNKNNNSKNKYLIELKSYLNELKNK